MCHPRVYLQCSPIGKSWRLWLRQCMSIESLLRLGWWGSSPSMPDICNFVDKSRLSKYMYLQFGTEWCEIYILHVNSGFLTPTPPVCVWQIWGLWWWWFDGQVNLHPTVRHEPSGSWARKPKMSKLTFESQTRTSIHFLSAHNIFGRLLKLNQNANVSY